MTITITIDAHLADIKEVAALVIAAQERQNDDIRGQEARKYKDEIDALLRKLSEKTLEKLEKDRLDDEVKAKELGIVTK